MNKSNIDISLIVVAILVALFILIWETSSFSKQWQWEKTQSVNFIVGDAYTSVSVKNFPSDKFIDFLDETDYKISVNTNTSRTEIECIVENKLAHMSSKVDISCTKTGKSPDHDKRSITLNQKLMNDSEGYVDTILKELRNTIKEVENNGNE